MSEPFLGQIMIFGGNFAPRGWAFCNGQLLPIAQNTALFSLLGTTYGGNGQSTFALPDLRGRAPIHFGQGPGLSNYVLGQLGGAESVTLSVAQMPAHTHVLSVSTSNGNDPSPAAKVLAKAYDSNTLNNINTYSNGAPDAALNGLAATGNGGSHENRPPYLAVNYIIALQGIYPSRN